jgi:hypothetical protein
MSDEVRISPLDRVVAAQQELNAALANVQVKAADGRTIVVYGQPNGSIYLYNETGQTISVNRERAKAIANGLYKLLGEDE